MIAASYRSTQLVGEQMQLLETMVPPCEHTDPAGLHGRSPARATRPSLPAWPGQAVSGEMQRALLEIVSEGVLVMDAAGNLTACNERFAALLGLPRSILLHETIDDFLSAPDALALKKLVSAEEPKIRSGFIALRHVEGSLIPVRISLSTSPGSDRRGGEVGAVVTDLRHERTTTAKLQAVKGQLDYEVARRRRVEQRYDFTLDLHGAASWEFDLASGRAAHARGTAGLLGSGPASWSIGATVEAFVGEDRASIADAFEAARLTGAIRVEGRCSQTGGGVRWIRLEGRSLSGPSFILAISAIDVTSQREH